MLLLLLGGWQTLASSSRVYIIKVCQVMKFAWLLCSLILRQEQGSEKETAEVNTQNLVICQGRGKYSQTTLHEAIA